MAEKANSLLNKKWMCKCNIVLKPK